MKYFFLIVMALSIFNLKSQDINNGNEQFFIKTNSKPSYNKATKNLSFLKFSPDKPHVGEGNNASEKAMNFLKQNKKIFSNKNENGNHKIKETKKDSFGKEHITLQQFYNNVPVYDGILKFHFNNKSDLTAINGNYVSVEKLNTTPSLNKEQAEDIAKKYLENLENSVSNNELRVKKSELFVFQKGLAQGYQGTVHLVYEVEITNENDLREFLYIDAHDAELVEQFSGMHQALDRQLYEVAPTTANLKWSEGNTFPADLDTWQQSELESAGHIYNMMKNAFGFVSFDNADSKMKIVNNADGTYWNGSTVNIGHNLGSDDVVAHEFGHAYTDNTSKLIYAWQSGALNESYSDIWGETVDQVNNYLDENENNALRTGCSSSTRWIIGEQPFVTNVGIRDMYNPNCKGSPAKVSDSQYVCGAVDNGGVHTNSGVQNHAYALLVDGGTYNGQTIRGLGLTKAAHIFWHAQTNYMIATTNFSAQADNLEASLTDLIGIDLPALTVNSGNSTLSGNIITNDDLIELQKVLTAVEMRADKNCGYATLLKTVEPICIGASPANAIFFEDFEDGLSGWTTSNIAGTNSNWNSKDWIADTTPPAGRNGTVAFGVNTNTGNCTNNNQNGMITITSPVITIPANTIGPFNVAFDHYISMEKGWDGGNIEYSIGGGPFQLVPLSAFTDNGYNTTLKSALEGSSNPLQGQPGFSGSDEGTLSGSWGQSRFTINGLLDNSDTNQTIQIRWNLGQDGCNGWEGWYIDDVRVYSCSLPTVKFATSVSIVNEAEGIIVDNTTIKSLPYFEKKVTIKINKTPSQPVTITLNPATGNATQGSTNDYSISPNSFVLQAGALSQDITVRVYNDSYVEGTESFNLTYTINAGGGDAIAEANGQSHTFIINDNDIEPGMITTELMNENFNGGIPNGWKIFKNDGITPDDAVYPKTWAAIKITNAALDPASPNLLIANSDATGRGLWDKIIESSPINTLGMTSIDLSFIEFFKVYNTAGDTFDELGTLEVWNGSAWINILTHTEAGGNVGQINAPFTRKISLVPYSNAAMKLRFRYTASWDYYWLIDNVKIIGQTATQIQTEVNSSNPAEAYLGPNETAIYYDPTSGKLLAKIKNLSNHNYGSTKVEIDRAGNGVTDWFGNYKITYKTFKVTPTTNNANGKYEITFYYKASEIAGATINSMGKNSDNIINGTSVKLGIGTGTTVFNNDYAYTVTFDTGFSSFGLSDAISLHQVALSVNLVDFNGKNTPDGNSLNWTTSNEINNDYFIIEKSNDAKNFIEVEKVVGFGNTNELKNYNYLDNNQIQGLNYYRLKQYDFNGNYKYSKTIAINSMQNNAISIFPNPVMSDLHIALGSDKAEMVDLKIVSATGEFVLQKTSQVRDNAINEAVENLTTGIYQVIVTSKTNTYNAKMFKQ